MGTQAEMIELGLVKKCGHVVVSEMRGQLFKDFCGAKTLTFGGLCSRHDDTKELVAQDKAAHERTIMVQRRYIEDVLFPQLTERIEAIIKDEEAKDADVIKIWQTTMDRIGLAAVQGIVLEGNLKIEAPLDILRGMLRPATDDDIIEAEVISA